MSDFEHGTVEANGTRFSYLSCGEGPLALCMHGFPDSPFTYRHLMPRLAAAGYRAVAPFMRGFAPSAAPPDMRYDLRTTGDDFNALHAALGGDSRAVLIAHDWGAVAAYAALAAAPARWRRAVIANIPPLPVFGQVAFDYAQLKRFFYIWFFQYDCAEDAVRANDFALLEGLWQDWSPGYDAREDLERAKACLREPAQLRAALGYYRSVMDPRRFGQPDYVAGQAEVWGRPLPQPTLYFHGLRDGCLAITRELAAQIPASLGPGSEVELLEDAGHFLLVEQPARVNARILDFLGRD